MPLSLIVLTSFYPAGQQALQYADALADCLGGRLVLLHVNRASLFDPYLFAGEGWQQQELRQSTDTALLLTRLAREQRAPAVVEVATDLLPGVARDVAARHQPALFVLGRPAPEHTSPAQLSAATGELLRAARLPLLVVPADQPGTLPPRRVLLAADGEDLDLGRSATLAQQLLQSLGPELTVAHVSAVEDDAGCTRAWHSVQSSGLAAGVAEVSLRGFVHEHPVDGLLAAVAETQADLLVVVARARSYWGEVFHRSVTAELVARCPVPVLVLSEPQVAAPAATLGQARGQFQG
ncbi:universal stress protein [Hymenobacter sp. B81]|uniref:universal stress protein n=1 Tax=Hymenobacter sp. B81 TaxID=3344878 RepID=UPI0037DC7CA5